MKAGTKRNCYPKNLVQALLLVHQGDGAMVARVEAEQDAVCDEMRATVLADPNLKRAREVATRYAAALDYEGRLTPLAIFNIAAILLIRAKLVYSDGTSDFHMFVYDGLVGRLMDSQRYSAGKEQCFVRIEECNRREPQAAIRALESLFSRTEVWVQQVYRVRPLTGP